MAISINHATKVIYIPKDFLTHIAGNLYELDVNELRLALKDFEDNEDWIFLKDTHRHNSEVTISGVTYARTFEIINGYTVTFEDGQYNVRCVGANHNLADVKNLNQVSLIVGNAAGLVAPAAEWTQAEKRSISANVGDIHAKLPLSSIASDLDIAALDVIHGEGSWEGAKPDEIDEKLTAEHGTGSWGGAPVEDIAKGVWDEKIGHEKPNTFGALMKDIISAARKMFIPLKRR